ncbi:hypothetical protein B296_00052539 [Ensete ventricosum]|uniref:Uncharacterized protein n=1 Tax=Ensete ventricosum TaxID=4639 RepID=A0A426YBW1_ENSVE|nr:hypothetical protein B296_00052539 [Ensete ventricosum]
MAKPPIGAVANDQAAYRGGRSLVGRPPAWVVACSDNTCGVGACKHSTHPQGVAAYGLDHRIRQRIEQTRRSPVG